MQTIIYNGNIYLEKGRYAEAVLIQDGVILKTGTTEEILAIAQDSAEKIDAQNNAVIPGFNDSHMHLYGVGQALESVPLYGATAICEVIRISKEFIQKNNVPAGVFVTGRGWNQDYFTDEGRILTRFDLDKISTEHPILFNRACGHMAVCNTKALELCNITSKTQQIQGAEFYLDDDGNPNGVFTEEAIKLISSHIPAPTQEDIARTINLAMDYALSQGITTVQTNDIHEDNYNNMYNAYKMVYSSSSARVRAYHQCYFSNVDSYSKFIQDGFSTGYGDDFNKIGPLKMFVDGSLGARTALLREHYADDTSTTGITCMTQAQLNEMIALADSNKCQVAVHAIGDKAIEMVLNGYDNVIENGNNSNRHAIVHCQITDVHILERFKNQNIYALVQPIFIHYDMHIVKDRVGEQLASTSYAFGDMLRMNINLSYGTDSPVEDLKTFDNLYCAIERKDLKGYPETGYYKEQGVSLEDAVNLYTFAGAKNSFEEDKKGKILPGYLADIVVLNKDIFNEDTNNLRDTKVAITIVNGNIAYKA